MTISLFSILAKVWIFDQHPVSSIAQLRFGRDFPTSGQEEEASLFLYQDLTKKTSSAKGGSNSNI